MVLAPTRPLHPLFGMEVEGVRMDVPLTPADRSDLLDQLHRHGVLLLRNQPLDMAMMAAFARSLGPIWGLPDRANQSAIIDASTDQSVVYRYSNRDADGNAFADAATLYRQIRNNENWHTDSTYSYPGSTVSIFLGVTMPAHEGNTEFCDTRVAFEGLSPTMQTWLRTLWAHHSLAYTQSYTDRTEAHDPEAIRRPLVRIHGESGREALQIASHIGLIEGMSKTESFALLDELIALSTTSERVYSHRWRPGDMLLWDNRCTLHRAAPYDPVAHPREMWIARIADASEMAQAEA